MILNVRIFYMVSCLGPVSWACRTSDTSPAQGTVAATANDEYAPSTTSAGTEAGHQESSTGRSTADTGSTGSDYAAWAAFAQLWPGLWVGPVDSMTSVGDFPSMNMDVRAADPYTLFSRTDLDAQNSLRFAFSLEEQLQAPHLVFRNGGAFSGVLRDTRTILEEADLDAQRWRFCALDGGCAYVEAIFDFDGEDRLDVHVDVMGKTHFDWPATRQETRELARPFPPDDQPQPADTPFPPMPTLRVEIGWATPLSADTDIWVLLSTTACGTGNACALSRFIRTPALAGATAAVATIDQIHPGDYKANAIADLNSNLAATFFPDTGDIIAIPDRPVTVAPADTTTVSMNLVVTL